MASIRMFGIVCSNLAKQLDRFYFNSEISLIRSKAFSDSLVPGSDDKMFWPVVTVTMSDKAMTGWHRCKYDPVYV